MKIVTKELTPALWPQLEALFGENGACGGCWCQAWKVADGEKWNEVQGSKAKARLRKGVRDRTTHGILAFVDGEPVGWCNFGPRLDYPRLERSRTLKCDDAERVWSVTCFYVHRKFRAQGVATALLDHAVDILRLALEERDRRSSLPRAPSRRRLPPASGRWPNR